MVYFGYGWDTDESGDVILDRLLKAELGRGIDGAPAILLRLQTKQQTTQLFLTPDQAHWLASQLDSAASLSESCSQDPPYLHLHEGA